jgi:hypothetical protein
VKPLIFASALLVPVFAQQQTGRIELTVTDATGLAIEAPVEIVSLATQVRRTGTTDTAGRYEARDLVFGPYHIKVERPGFAPFIEVVDVRSEAPVQRRISLGVAAIETVITINETDTLLDPHRTGTVHHIGRETLESRGGAAPARGILELVNSQPGWLLEANGVLHPRGSEYDTQYVIDGFPILDNRSPAFAPAFEPEELSAMRILTGGYPAEYGRKLGGVVELLTARDTRRGFHATGEFQAGSFDTGAAYLLGHYSTARAVVALSAQSATTARFLDPPVEANFTNTSTSGGGAARFEYDWSDRDRTRLYFHRKRAGFLVPNEFIQQDAGQRQDRTTEESMGQAGYQRVLSPEALFAARVMVRDVAASLWSNPFSTPIRADQDRGFRETYLTASMSAASGRHSLKFGTEAALTSVQERFGYRISDRDYFDDELPVSFRFADQRRGREHSAYLQDVVRAGDFTFSAGVRWDRYRLLITETFISPRLGASWNVPGARLVLRGCYDRAVTIPAIENLLLASSPESQGLTDESAGSAVRPSRGNFYEVGASKSLGRLRLDASWFRRNIRHYADDDVFLNTGVSFPVAFDHAVIRGFEAKLETARWWRLSGFASYSNLSGTGFLPITGGLSLDDAEELTEATGSFPISQDQRNTFRTRVRFDVHARVWTALGYSYNSGLPVEREGEFEDGFDDLDDLRERYGERVVSQIDFARGRVRPSSSIDVAAAADVWRTDAGTLTVQGEVLNLANRINVVNFAGLFSGTAIAPPRTFYVRLQVRF